MKKLLQRMLQKFMAFRQHKSSIRPRISANRKSLTAGFTLIELLVAALIASLMVGIMLSFLVGVLDSDRKETAKSNAQEELQAAISYISDDLQEAVYIYGSEALAGINTQLPHTQTQNTAGNECNPATTRTDGFTVSTCTPVLVFWKRYVYNPTSTATYTNAAATPASDKIGCMPYKDAGTNLAKTNCNASTSPYGGDRYTYALVAYYLKNDAVDSSVSTTTWSKTARILRWELKDGYAAYCYNGKAIDVDTTNCPQTWVGRLASPLISTSGVFLTDPVKYFVAPSPGFNRPDFTSSGTLSSLSGGWKKFDYFRFTNTGNPTFPFSPFVTLVDLMDDTAYTTAQDGNSAATGNGTSAIATAVIKIPIGKDNTVAGVASPTNFDCDNPSIGVGNANPASTTNTTGGVTQRVPADFNDTTSNPAQLSSFYACVTPESITARIYMRGNALARLGSPPIARGSRPATTNNITFFPTADVRAFGRSAIGIKTK
jgi:type II secretory pathway pseudopilin PulG